ncbi:MAG TPA: VCBS repeat-containing protein, partial [Pyrinomonadaceae bacterium]|nr:VCBS repeat-containing protein [Pyrinomonadaceae bacterium]
MIRGKTARIILGLCFVALLATPLILRWRAKNRENTAADPSTALARYGFYLQEVAQASKVNFTHHPPTLDHQLDHIMPQVASMGAAVSVVDFNRDGWADLYVTNSGEGSKNSLFKNNTDGTFSDVATEMGVADLNQVGTGVSMGSVWGDYDNDGYEDLFLYKWGKPELFHNDAGGKFSRVSGKATLPAWVNANTAVWFDYDRDGRLDLFLGGYYAEDVDLWHLKNTKMMPESFEYAKNGGRKYLFRNLGDGAFEEVSQKVGIDTRRWALAATVADLRGTGNQDLFIANDYG